MTRRVFVLTNARSGRVIGRGPLRAVRCQRQFWALMYAKAAIPADLRIDLAPRLTLVTRARETGCI